MQIAARVSMWSGARTPCARDYVQDGQVRRWDGIEHSLIANEWDDLANGVKITLPPFSGNSLAFSSNALRMTTIDGGVFGQINTGYADSIASGDFSVGATVSFNMTTAPLGTAGICDWFGAVRPLRIGTNGSVSMFISGIGAVNLENIGGQQSYSLAIVTDRTNSKTYFYANGELVETLNAAMAGTTTRSLRMFYCPTGGWPAGQVIDIHSAWQYSRALTASEIARNYAIDKERFGLT